MSFSFSVVILSSDSHVNKGESVFHCLQSILNQKSPPFEVILVENSTFKNKIYLEKIKKFSKKFKNKGIQFVLVDNPKKISRGEARNCGAEIAKGDVLIFLDDDTVLFEDDSFTKMFDKADKFHFGYGAIRYWTQPQGWFESNSDLILSDLEKGENPFCDHLGEDNSKSRKSTLDILQSHTFIGNFGFCRKTLLDSVGGFPSFNAYGYEDDCLMFRLFQENGNYVILNCISVAHVNHEIDDKESNVLEYYNILKESGYFWFDVKKTFESQEQLSVEQVCESLSAYHPDYRVLNAYAQYKNYIAPHVNPSNNELWIKHKQYSFIDYCHTLKALTVSSCLNEFVVNSRADFDTLIPFLNSCIKAGLIQIDVDGVITDTLNFRYFENRLDVENLNKITFLNPGSSLNQFPCDVDSRNRRLDLIKERYPYADHLRIGVIGDDDLLTPLLNTQGWIETCTLDADKKVLQAINDLCGFAEIHECNLENEVSQINSVETFITDPPYTLHGALLFILRGLELMTFSGETKEFYVILNEKMLGAYMKELQKILLQNGVWLYEIRSNFSQYKIPTHFEERSRANKFLESNKIDLQSLEYSSSSALFIFRTINPNINSISKSLNFKKIYKHLI